MQTGKASQDSTESPTGRYTAPRKTQKSDKLPEDHTHQNDRENHKKKSAKHPHRLDLKPTAST